MSIIFHEDIMKKLNYFHKVSKIPNIVFNGPSGSGKSTILNKFISLIYNNNKELIKEFVMYVNCSHCKGIRFIREELKFFAKTYINSNGGNRFKSIVFFNGDKLTVDAQSALRRCIELFSHNTRFFIIVENKNKLLRPILSRFCEIYVPYPKLKDEPINLYKFKSNETFKFHDIKKQQLTWLKNKIIKKMNKQIKLNELQTLVEELYEKSYSALDVIQLIEDDAFNFEEERRFELLVSFNVVRQEYRNEKLLLLFILHFVFVDSNTCLENLSFI